MPGFFRIFNLEKYIKNIKKLLIHLRQLLGLELVYRDFG